MAAGQGGTSRDRRGGTATAARRAESAAARAGRPAREHAGWRAKKGLANPRPRLKKKAGKAVGYCLYGNFKPAQAGAGAGNRIDAIGQAPRNWAGAKFMPVNPRAVGAPWRAGASQAAAGTRRFRATGQRRPYAGTFGRREVAARNTERRAGRPAAFGRPNLRASRGWRHACRRARAARKGGAKSRRRGPGMR